MFNLPPIKHISSDSLRALADILNSITAAGATVEPAGLDLSFYSLGIGEEEKTNLAIIAKVLETFDKVYSNDFFRITKSLPGLRITFVAYRHNICEKVQVGEKEIPEQIIEARAAEVIPAKMVPIYEWKCPDSLLASPPQAADEAKSFGEAE